MTPYEMLHMDNPWWNDHLESKLGWELQGELAGKILAVWFHNDEFEGACHGNEELTWKEFNKLLAMWVFL